MHLQRRSLIAAGLALALPAAARSAPKTVRVGFQKGEPVLMAARANKALEAALAPRGIGVEWIEFQFGPPMLEAMRVGSIDVGAVGDTPPVFAQAARGDLMYIAANQGAPQSVLLPPGSKIETLADLKGKKIAFGRGSSAHNFLLMVLEKAGLRYDQIEPLYLGPADAGPAFERGAVDAWSIWEPYTSLFNTRPDVRTLTTNTEIGTQYGYIMGSGPFVRANPDLTGTVLDVLAKTGELCRKDHAPVAALLSEATGMAAATWERAIAKDAFELLPMTPAVVAGQQAVADRFHALNLIPVEIKVADIVWQRGEKA
jgi:NitT/TauT family transport system substrate-binding protein/sulfonate transport system substrate-binding protein